MAEVKREYYPNGELQSEWFEINRKKEGQFKTYYENGQIRYCCIYVNNTKHGEEKQYGFYGRLDSISNYNNGKIQSWKLQW
jgi:antitoxin component YwqK of YwqJK toxin-antitoxin module